MSEEYNKALHTRLVSMRRELHEHPELSFQEFETTKKSAAGWKKKTLQYWTLRSLKQV